MPTLNSNANAEAPKKLKQPRLASHLPSANNWVAAPPSLFTGCTIAGKEVKQKSLRGAGFFLMVTACFFRTELE